MNTISKSDVKLLSAKKYKKFNVIPSESIYYGDRPYKAVLDIKFPTEALVGESKRYHWWSWVDIVRKQCAYLGMTNVRTQGRFPKLHLYFYEKEGIDMIIKHFKDRVLSISGPISKNHLDLIYSKRHFKVRDKLFFNKYPMRVDVGIPWRKYGLRSYAQRRQIIHEVREFVRDNLDEGRLSSTNWRCTFFSDQEEAKHILPFVALQWPDTEVEYTDCYLPGSL